MDQLVAEILTEAAERLRHDPLPEQVEQALRLLEGVGYVFGRLEQLEIIASGEETDGADIQSH
jgi:hypothetical protein